MTTISDKYKAAEAATTAAVADRTDTETAGFRQVLENLVLGVLVFDKQYCLLYANPAAVELLGPLTVKIEGSDSSLGLTIEEVFPDDVFSGWADTLKSAEGLHTCERATNLIAHCGGSERIFSASVARVEETSADDSALILTLDDITAREETDQRLFLIEKSSDKGVMAAHIAHDLNNFLGLVLGGVEIAQMAMAKGNIEKADRSLEKIKSNVGRLETFTRDLEQLADFETNMRDADFNQVVAGSISYVAVQKKFKAIEIRTTFDCSIPRFDIDTTQIEQLLLNVLTNAADAVAESGRSDGRISVRTWLQDDCACLSIADNGTGIKPEIKERLFRSHLTTKPNNYGYGLVTCSRIISDHQAQFEIESEAGQGATFTFRFPLHPEPERIESDD